MWFDIAPKGFFHCYKLGVVTIENPYIEPQHSLSQSEQPFNHAKNRLSVKWFYIALVILKIIHLPKNL